MLKLKGSETFDTELYVGANGHLCIHQLGNDGEQLVILDCKQALAIANEILRLISAHEVNEVHLIEDYHDEEENLQGDKLA